MPGDKVLVKPLEPKEKSPVITVLGEVKNPGVYNYKPDLTLYDILQQTGGYTKEAYPYGLVYIKENAKKMQEAYVNDGIMVNSAPFDGINNLEAMEKIADFMEDRKIGKRMSISG